MGLSTSRYCTPPRGRQTSHTERKQVCGARSVFSVIDFDNWRPMGLLSAHPFAPFSPCSRRADSAEQSDSSARCPEDHRGDGIGRLPGPGLILGYSERRASLFNDESHLIPSPRDLAGILCH